jgi:hypothetical protein
LAAVATADFVDRIPRPAGIVADEVTSTRQTAPRRRAVGLSRRSGTSCVAPCNEPARTLTVAQTVTIHLFGQLRKGHTNCPLLDRLLAAGFHKRGEFFAAQSPNHVQPGIDLRGIGEYRRTRSRPAKTAIDRLQ